VEVFVIEEPAAEAASPPSLAKSLGFKREARAAPPMPVAVRLKKWRRVRRR